MRAGTVVRCVWKPVLGIALLGIMCCQQRGIAGEAEHERILVLHDQVSEYVPTNTIAVFVDSSAALQISDIISPRYARRFTYVKGQAPSFKPSPYAIWVRLEIIDSTTRPNRWTLSFGYAAMDTIMQFEFTGGAWDTTLVWSSFDTPNRSTFHHRLPSFVLPLEPNRRTTCYFRVTCAGSKPLLMTVRSEAEQKTSELHDQFMLGGFYGILSIMIIYNLILFFSVRDSSYLYYSLYAASFGFYEYLIDGLYTITLSGYVPYRHAFIFLSVFASILLGALFARQYLNTRRSLPRFDKLLLIFMGFMTISILLVFFLSTRNVDRLTAPVGMGYLAICLIGGILSLRNGFKPARYYLIGVTGFAAGMLLRTLRIAGVLPMTELVQNAVQIGFLWEVSIFSFALGNRINTMRDEKEREKEQMRMKIADDLHDEIGSNLSSISVESQMMKRRLPLDSENIRHLDDITRTAVQTADAMRDIVWFIDPGNDDPLQISQKMEEKARQLLQCEQLEISIDPEVFSRVKDLQMRRNLFLIYKEALNNILRHAGASAVSISLKRADSAIILQIEDNGCGFDEAAADGGHGLQSFRHRARQLNGELSIGTQPGKGTKLRLAFKIP